MSELDTDLDRLSDTSANNARSSSPISATVPVAHTKRLYGASTW